MNLQKDGLPIRDPGAWHVLPQVVSIVISNLVYVIGVLFFSWDVFDILVIFWMENVLLGFSGLFRLMLAGQSSFFRRIQVGVFFCVGTAMLSMVFGLFAFVFFSGLNVQGDREASLAAMATVLTEPSVILSALCMTAGLIYDFIFGYVRSGAFRKAQADWEMTHVGIRQFLLMLGLGFGGALLQQHGSPIPGLLLVVSMKVTVELLLSVNRRFAPPAE